VHQQECGSSSKPNPGGLGGFMGLRGFMLGFVIFYFNQGLSSLLVATCSSQHAYEIFNASHEPLYINKARAGEGASRIGSILLLLG
jgi:hypothetical protein